MSENPDTSESDIFALVRSRARLAVQSSLITLPLVLLFSCLSSVLVARLLGPSGYLVLASVSAVATSISTFMDLGLAKSSPKILGDIGISFGKRAVENVARNLLMLHIGLFFVGWIIFVSLINQQREVNHLLGSTDFVLLLLLRLIISAVINIQRALAIAVIKTALLNRFALIQSISEPTLVVLVTIIFNDPYLVVATGLMLDCIFGIMMRRHQDYDLSNEAQQDSAVFGRSLFRKTHFQFAMLTYGKFFFNRFLVGSAFVFFVLTSLSYDPLGIAQAMMAWTIANQFLSIADLPFSQVYAPVISYLHGKSDQARLIKIHRLASLATVYLSGLSAITLSFVGAPVLGLVYGVEYARGVSWGVLIAIVFLIINSFSLGNRLLQQRDYFRVQIFFLVLSSMIVISLASLSYVAQVTNETPLYLLGIVVLGKAVFWIGTDWSASVSNNLNYIRKKMFMTAGITALCVLSLTVNCETLICRVVVFFGCIISFNLLFILFFKTEYHVFQFGLSILPLNLRRFVPKPLGM